MSRWLKSVNQMLEALDDQVGEVIEENKNNVGDDDDDEDDEENGNDAVDDILKRRGLLGEKESVGKNEEDDRDGDDQEEDDVDEVNRLGSDAELSSSLEELTVVKKKGEDDNENDIVNEETQVKEGNESEKEATPVAKDDDRGLSQSISTESSPSLSKESPDEDGAEEMNDESREEVSLSKSDAETTFSKNDEVNDDGDKVSPKIDVLKQEKEEKKTDPKSSTTDTIATDDSNSKNSNQNNDNNHPSQKEVRRLRRHVVDLHSQMEALEKEVTAQAVELRNAATRMERDAVRYREDLDSCNARRKKELTDADESHRRALQNARRGWEEERRGLEERLGQLSQQRRNESDHARSDLTEALGRERTLLERLSRQTDELEESKTTLQTLQTQLSATRTALETTQEEARLSAEREREAEDRWEASVRAHAASTSTRQSRERELEKMVAELTGALMVARQTTSTNNGNDKDDDNDNDDDDGDNPTQEDLRRRLDTATAQLEMEVLRADTLHRELMEVTVERSNDEANAVAERKKYERREADWSARTKKLEEELGNVRNEMEQLQRRRRRRQSSNGDDDDDEFFMEESNDAEMTKNQTTTTTPRDDRMAILARENLDQRSKLEIYATEVSTLKERLRQERRRAETAESLLSSSTSGSSAFSTTINSDDLEAGRRFPFNKNSKYSAGKNKSSLVMNRKNRLRHVLGIDDWGAIVGTTGTATTYREPNPFRDAVANALDVVDDWSTWTVAYLRPRPLARGIFAGYLGILHFYVFILVWSFHMRHPGADLPTRRHDFAVGVDQLVMRNPLRVIPPETEPLTQASQQALRGIADILPAETTAPTLAP